jgi:hypothetical protein
MHAATNADAEVEALGRVTSRPLELINVDSYFSSFPPG